MDLEIKDKETNNVTVEETKEPTINDNLYKSTDWMIKDIGEIDPNLTDFEKNVLLTGTYSVTELLEKEKEEKVIEQDPAKVYITKVKCIALKKLGYHPLTNPSNLTNREKAKIIKRMDKILKEKTEEQVNSRFNKLVLDDILSENADYTKYSIYN